MSAGPDVDRPLVTRRAPRSLTLGEVPNDQEPKFINQDERGVGDCTACGAAIRPSGQIQHRWWHLRYLGDVKDG